jgi:predicted TIM-barrel fold metal-dependent hydrolase
MGAQYPTMNNGDRHTKDEPRDTALPATPQAKSLIDCHVHLAALPDGGNGCYISPTLLRSPLFRFLLWKHDLSPRHPREANRKYINELRQELLASAFVQKAVLLGMDGCYDATGRLDKTHTEFLIPNDYVFATVARYPHEFLAGVSINPQRQDALKELHRCAERGAALVKILANVQQFDPADARYKQFYRTMAERGLPLLSHVGYEFSLIGKDQSLGDPARLRVPLDEGVTVIAAHACSSGLVVHEKFLPTFIDLAQRYAHFYADISSLTLPNRMRMLLCLRHLPHLHDRLLFGTDYPLSVFHLPAWGRLRLGALKMLIRTKNRFDRHYLVCKGLKVGFRSIADLLPSLTSSKM